jgi:hypothetical protein
MEIILFYFIFSIFILMSYIYLMADEPMIALKIA